MHTKGVTSRGSNLNILVQVCPNCFKTIYTLKGPVAIDSSCSLIFTLSNIAVLSMFTFFPDLLKSLAGIKVFLIKFFI